VPDASGQGLSRGSAREAQRNWCCSRQPLVEGAQTSPGRVVDRLVRHGSRSYPDKGGKRFRFDRRKSFLRITGEAVRLRPRAYGKLRRPGRYSLAWLASRNSLTIRASEGW
jgi:hypothetical protein